MSPFLKEKDRPGCYLQETPSCTFFKNGAQLRQVNFLLTWIRREKNLQVCSKPKEKNVNNDPVPFRIDFKSVARVSRNLSVCSALSTKKSCPFFSFQTQRESITPYGGTTNRMISSAWKHDRERERQQLLLLRHCSQLQSDNIDEKRIACNLVLSLDHCRRPAPKSLDCNGLAFAELSRARQAGAFLSPRTCGQNA